MNVGVIQTQAFASSIVHCCSQVEWSSH
jgi:hypothetical protein